MFGSDGAAGLRPLLPREAALDAAVRLWAPYQEIVDNARAAIGARIVVLTRLDPDGQEAQTVAWSGLQRSRGREALAAAQRLIPGFEPTHVTTRPTVNEYQRRIFLDGQAVEAPYPDLARGIVDDRILGLGALILGIRHSFTCPLKVSGRVAGSLSFMLTKPFTDAQRRTCEAFARQVSLSLENVYLLEALQAEVAERERMAMDLHDGVLQALYAVMLKLGAQERVLPAGAEQAREAVHQAVLQVAGIIPEVRSYIVDLRPQQLGQNGLHAGLEILADELRSTGRLRVDLRLDADGADTLTPDDVTELLLIVREATSNVVRHAEATAVTIQLAEVAGRLRVVVRDNGRGFEVDRLRHRGRRAGDGLRNMGERARKLGGHLALRSEPGRGTEARVELPRRAPARPA